MGLFLALSGVINASATDVRSALSDFVKERSGGFELVPGTTDEPNIGIIAQTGPHTTVLYPDGFCEWDDASEHISAQLKCPVFSLHIHDEDLWMFLLFQDGKEVGRFNPMPNYWDELSPEEMAEWRGDASLIAQLVPGVSVASISKYLVEWDLDEVQEQKAYPDDKAPRGDCWQLCDFMDKIGLEYPLREDGTIVGETFRLWTYAFPLQGTGK